MEAFPGLVQMNLGRGRVVVGMVVENLCGSIIGPPPSEVVGSFSILKHTLSRCLLAGGHEHYYDVAYIL